MSGSCLTEKDGGARVECREYFGLDAAARLQAKADCTVDAGSQVKRTWADDASCVGPDSYRFDPWLEGACEGIYERGSARSWRYVAHGGRGDPSRLAAECRAAGLAFVPVEALSGRPERFSFTVSYRATQLDRRHTCTEYHDLTYAEWVAARSQVWTHSTGMRYHWEVDDEGRPCTGFPIGGCRFDAATGSHRIELYSEYECPGADCTYPSKDDARARCAAEGGAYEPPR